MQEKAQKWRPVARPAEPVKATAEEPSGSARNPDERSDTGGSLDKPRAAVHHVTPTTSRSPMLQAQEGSTGGTPGALPFSVSQTRGRRQPIGAPPSYTRTTGPLLGRLPPKHGEKHGDGIAKKMAIAPIQEKVANMMSGQLKAASGEAKAAGGDAKVASSEAKADETKAAAKEEPKKEKKEEPKREERKASKEGGSAYHVPGEDDLISQVRATLGEGPKEISVLASKFAHVFNEKIRGHDETPIQSNGRNDGSFKRWLVKCGFQLGPPFGTPVRNRALVYLQPTCSLGKMGARFSAARLHEAARAEQKESKAAVRSKPEEAKGSKESAKGSKEVPKAAKEAVKEAPKEAAKEAVKEAPKASKEAPKKEAAKAGKETSKAPSSQPQQRWVPCIVPAAKKLAEAAEARAEKPAEKEEKKKEAPAAPKKEVAAAPSEKVSDVEAPTQYPSEASAVAAVQDVPEAAAKEEAPEPQKAPEVAPAEASKAVPAEAKRPGDVLKAALLQQDQEEKKAALCMQEKEALQAAVLQQLQAQVQRMPLQEAERKPSKEALQAAALQQMQERVEAARPAVPEMVRPSREAQAALLQQVQESRWASKEAQRLCSVEAERRKAEAQAAQLLLQAELMQRSMVPAPCAQPVQRNPEATLLQQVQESRRASKEAARAKEVERMTGVQAKLSDENQNRPAPGAQGVSQTMIPAPRRSPPMQPKAQPEAVSRAPPGLSLSMPDTSLSQNAGLIKPEVSFQGERSPPGLSGMNLWKAAEQLAKAPQAPQQQQTYELVLPPRRQASKESSVQDTGHRLTPCVEDVSEDGSEVSYSTEISTASDLQTRTLKEHEGSSGRRNSGQRHILHNEENLVANEQQHQGEVRSASKEAAALMDATATKEDIQKWTNEIHRLDVALASLANFFELQPSCIQETVRQVLAVGWSTITWRRGYTGLHLAAELGQCEVIPLLVSLKADPNGIDKKCRSPLDIARSKQHWNCVHALTELGGDREKQAPKQSKKEDKKAAPQAGQLPTPSFAGNTKIAEPAATPSLSRLVKEARRKLFAFSEVTKLLTLDPAIVRAIQGLIAEGPSSAHLPPSIQQPRNSAAEWPPLHTAVVCSRDDVMPLMVALGADPTAAMSSTGLTALDLAKVKRLMPCVSMLERLRRSTTEEVEVLAKGPKSALKDEASCFNAPAAEESARTSSKTSAAGEAPLHPPMAHFNDWLAC